VANSLADAPHVAAMHLQHVHVCTLYRVLATFAEFARCDMNCLTKGTEWRWVKYSRTNQCRRKIEFTQTAFREGDENRLYMIVILRLKAGWRERDFY